MTTFLAIILSIIFSLLGFLHFYWLVGGQWGLKQVIPTKSPEQRFDPPPKFATLLVGVGLISVGLLYLIKAGVVLVQLPSWLSEYGYWVVPIVFLLRAIGEFHYVGFFKRVKGTDFAKADSKWFSPLCLSIAIMGMVIQLIG